MKRLLNLLRRINLRRQLSRIFGRRTTDEFSRLESFYQMEIQRLQHEIGQLRSERPPRTRQDDLKLDIRDEPHGWTVQLAISHETFLRLRSDRLFFHHIARRLTHMLEAEARGHPPPMIPTNPMFAPGERFDPDAIP